MIGVVGLDGGAGRWELSFRRPPLSDRSAMPVLIGMGDPVAGPLVGLFYDDPSTPEQLAGPPDLAPAHSHPCDNFRVVMKGELWVGRERYHHGEFRLQRSGIPYGRDGDAPDVEGNWRIIFFADRRGHRVRPTNPELRAQSSSPEAFALTKQRYGDVLPVILADEDDGVDGLVTTIDKPFSKLGHIDGSFEDSGQWEPVGDGRQAAVSLLGVHDVGPVVILQRTAPGVMATPGATFDSDVFRCVIRGSSVHEGAVSEMGDTLLRPAGDRWEPVTAGPDGLDEVLIIGDRTGAVPTSTDDAAWAEWLDATLARLRARLDAPVAS
jgi:hypothetical protein